MLPLNIRLISYLKGRGWYLGDFKFAIHTREERGYTAKPRGVSGYYERFMEQMLVVSALGGSSSNVVRDLTKVVLDCGGNIKESRMAALGADFAMILLVSGNWHTMNKLEQDLSRYAQSDGLVMQVKRTEPREFAKELLPYAVDVVGLDQPGVVNSLSAFFAARSVEIGDVTTRSYQANSTGTPMFSVQMLINIPASVHISGLREEFMEFCDQMNVDAIIEPVKHA